MKILFAVILSISLAACAPLSSDDASPEEIAAVAYVAGGAPKLTLITVVNNRTGSGGHTALIVSGSQQVLFDPAGSFRHETLVERGDVFYGITPAWISSYKSAHARSAYHVVSQTIEVTPAQAEHALQLVQSNGAVGAAFCANSTSSILRQVPGFEDIDVTFFPVKLMDQIARRPDVSTDLLYENDAGDVLDGITPIDA
ncbi:MAG: hypothetical protein ABJL72_02975 [Roseobacter sp.]